MSGKAGGRRSAIDEKGSGKSRGSSIKKCISARGAAARELHTPTPLYIHCGDHSEEDPPVLIPNTEVKLFYAESTERETAWEDRKLPHFIHSAEVTPRRLLLDKRWA